MVCCCGQPLSPSCMICLLISIVINSNRSQQYGICIRAAFWLFCMHCLCWQPGLCIVIIFAEWMSLTEEYSCIHSVKMFIFLSSVHITLSLVQLQVVFQDFFYSTATLLTLILVVSLKVTKPLREALKVGKKCPCRRHSLTIPPLPQMSTETNLVTYNLNIRTHNVTYILHLYYYIIYPSSH